LDDAPDSYNRAMKKLFTRFTRNSMQRNSSEPRRRSQLKRRNPKKKLHPDKKRLMSANMVHQASSESLLHHQKGKWVLSKEKSRTSN